MSTVKDCKEKFMIGKTFVNGSDLLCPVSTSTAVAISEQPELRAYKLGKQKCSYNQVELLFHDLSGDKPTEMKISEAIETSVGAEVEEYLRESCLRFNVRFLNNRTMHLYIYVVYADAHLKLNSPGSDNPSLKYYWMPLTRSKCKKGCAGPVIRGLQRFGKMSRRVVGQEGGDQDAWKEPKHLYIAIDEASTHVCTSPSVAPKFRLLLAAYNEKYELLGTTISSSIRVLANNDAPLGAASFKIHFNLEGGWGETIGQKPREIGRSDGMPAQEIEENKSPTAGNRTDKLASLSAIAADVLDAKERQGMYSKSPSTQNLNQKGCPPDNHSLNELCERIFMFCASKVDSIISLRTLATLLGTRKRRIYEIFNVLQCVLIVQQQERAEKYLWLGATRVSYAIKKLTVEEALSRKSCRARKFRLLSEEMAENPMRELTERFIQLFLVDEERSITLEVATEAILDKHNDPQTYRCKIRRLTEIARIFTALNLISIDNTADHAFSTGSLYSWRGARGVQERLEIAGESNTMKIDRRRRIQLKCTQKAVKHKKPTVENAGNTMASSMPRLVSDSDIDDESVPSLEADYNRPIKRPRLCSTTGTNSTDIYSTSKLPRENPSQSLTASKFNGSSPSGKESADYSLSVKNSNQELHCNNIDRDTYEAASMLVSLSSYTPIKEQSSSQGQADHHIEAKEPPQPATSNELLPFQPHNSEFNPLHYLQQLFSASQIAELQAKNAGFIVDFVRYSRQLYHWERPGHGTCVNLFKPVPLRAHMIDIYNSADDKAAGGHEHHHAE